MRADGKKKKYKDKTKQGVFTGLFLSSLLHADQTTATPKFNRPNRQCLPVSALNSTSFVA